MTFPETLRELARLRPEKFRILQRTSLGGLEEFAIMDAGERGNILDSWILKDTVFYQDDIDSILAELGWEYQLFPRVKEGKATEWGFIVWELGKAPLRVTGEWFKDKGKAAQAALTAVVEEIKKGEK